MKVREENEKVGLKLNIQKIKIMASVPITSGQIDGETMETVTDFIFLELSCRSCLYILEISCLSVASFAIIFNFKAAVTICSDFGAQKNKVRLGFHCFPIYLA